MNVNNPREGNSVDVRRGVARWVVKNCFAVLLVTAVLFLAAGRLGWRWGWAFVALAAANVITLAILLIPTRPELLAERSGVKAGTKRWDLVLAPLLAYSSLIAALVAAFDFRWGWSPPFPPVIHVAGLAVAAAGSAFTAWAMYTNRFFAATVRIQTDRGHEVVSAGPYRLVRHPGYLGAAVYMLGLPLMLGSFWAAVPVAVGLITCFVRTSLEDRTLRRELPGYEDYARRVRRRLVPGVW
ncbi:MAG: isoprenylcysteine carboxylmethyltransferase family protein [Candidatus Zixiibacteriota bacterium]|jgi:protein-S-isoprenylcysteine O-methyltransferase Ste14